MQASDSKGVRSLWGHEFRVISEGLAESDVVAFVEGLMSQYQASMEKAKHVVALREHALRTVEQAERLAEEIKEEAKTQLERRSAEVISAAEQAAQEITERAARAAAAIEADSREKARERIAALESTFLDIEATFLRMTKCAKEEFQALRNFDETTKAFVSTFQTLLSLLGRHPLWADYEVARNGEVSASENRARQLDAEKDIDKD